MSSYDRHTVNVHGVVAQSIFEWIETVCHTQARLPDAEGEKEKREEMELNVVAWGGPAVVCELWERESKPPCRVPQDGTNLAGRNMRASQ